jgi:hypothetical protein
MRSNSMSSYWVTAEGAHRRAQVRSVRNHAPSACSVSRDRLPRQPRLLWRGKQTKETAVVATSAERRVGRGGAGDARTRTALLQRFSGAAESRHARQAVAFGDHNSPRWELHAGQVGRLSCVELL